MKNYEAISPSKPVILLLYSLILLTAACSPKLRLSSSENALYPISADQPKDRAILV